MLTHPTLEQMASLGLNGMAAAWRALAEQEQAGKLDQRPQGAKDKKLWRHDATPLFRTSPDFSACPGFPVTPRATPHYPAAGKGLRLLGHIKSWRRRRLYHRPP